MDINPQAQDPLPLIDTHAHLDELEDLEASLKRAQDVGVVVIIAVGVDYKSNVRVLEIAEKYSGFVYPALGLHPWQLGMMDAKEFEQVLRLIEDNVSKVVAIGEVGLDYHKRVRAGADKGQQKKAFASLLELAASYDKPILIHSRYAWQDAFALTKEAKIKRAVFHWYTGFSSVLHQIIASGYLLSATPAAEYHREHRRAIREAPLTSLLLETDCPVEYGREARFRAEPADVMRSLAAVAELKGLDKETIATTTANNAVAFFDLVGPG